MSQMPKLVAMFRFKCKKYVINKMITYYACFSQYCPLIKPPVLLLLEKKHKIDYVLN